MDYNDHTKHDGSSYLAHFNGSEPFRQEKYTYATTDWGERARKIFSENREKPQFVYLSFNAPHEPVTAPGWLKKPFREMYPKLSETRIEFLAAVKEIDRQIRFLHQTLEKIQRETIIIFQSDNGASILEKGSGLLKLNTKS